MAKRAITDEAKNKKKELILKGAIELLEEGIFPLPSVNEIVKHIGEAKGTVYLYFSSKEEIYLTAMTTTFAVVVEKLMERLKTKKYSTPAAIAITLKEFADQNPKIVYLATITPIVLEQNASDEFVSEFKKQLLHMTNIISKIIHDKDGVSLSQARVKFLVSYNLFIGMWQHLNPPRKIQSLIEKNNLLDLQFDFGITYRKMLDRIWSE